MSNINTNATVTLNVNGKEAQATLDGLKKKSQDLEEAIRKAAAAGDKTNLKKLQRELKQTNKQINDIESATMGVERVMRNLDKATPKELQKTLRELKKQLGGIERGTEEWNRQTAAIRRVKQELDRVNAEMQVSEGRWQKLNRIFNEWQTAILGVAAAITGMIVAGRSAVSAYAEMEGEMANVRKFTGMTAEEVEELNEEFKKMDTRTSRQDLNKLAEEAGRLGKTSKEDVLGFVKAADQINVALDDLGEGATLTLSKLTSIFGDEERLGTEKALLAVGSVINELSQNCTASAPYLAQFSQRLAGVGAQAKMTIPQIMGFAAVLDSQGQAVEMSATALSTLITDLFKNTDKIIKATGMNAKTFKETLARDTNEALIMLIERLHELGNIDVLAPVFKDMGENGTRATGVLAALAGNIDKVKWEQEEANKAFNEATSVTGEFNVQNNTVQAGLDKAGKRVKELAIELGQMLLPVMRHVISSTTLLLKFMKGSIDFFVKYKVEIIAASTVLAAYAVAVNLAAIKTKIAAAATAAWNAVVKVGNILLPIAQVMINGLKLAYERLIWQTRGANATQQAYNKSLAALKANAAAAKAAMGLLAVAIAAGIVALVRWTKSLSVEAQVQASLNKIKSEAIQKAEEEKIKIDNLIKAANNETLSMYDRQRAVIALNKIIPGYNAQLDATTGKYKANKQALDKYIESLVRMYEVMGAKEKIKEIGAQKADLSIQIAEQEQQIKEEKERLAEQSGSRSGKPQTSGGGVPAGAAYEQMGGAASIAGMEMNLEGKKRRLKVLDKTVDVLKELYGDDIQKSEIEEKNIDEVEPPKATPPSSTSTSDKNTGKDKTEDKLKAEKDWMAKQEALNRIAYATGVIDYEQYTMQMLAIEEEYNKKILERSDLTEQEKLDAQVGYYEAQKKEREEAQKQTVEEEEAHYNALVARHKQMYIDGETDQKTMEASMELLELEHLRRMLSITKEGTKERLQAEKAYQDKLIADMKKRQQEAEKLEKEHQQKLKELKNEYFGDNPKERQQKYDSDIKDLEEVYNSEIKAAGDNAKEKLRIEEAYEKAKKALREKYGIESAEDEKNRIKEWVEEVDEWLKDPGKGGIWTRSFETIVAGMSSIFQQLTSLINAETEKQTAAIEERYDKEKSKAEGNNYQVKKLEEKKQKELAKVKNEANRKLFAMQVIQAVAETAQGAINAYSSAAAIPMVGWVMAPIAATMAIAAGMLQVAAIKKQQQASEAQGYAEGGFTGQGGKYEVAGVVHKGEWVANQELVSSPVARPMIDALDYAQRTNTIGSLRSRDVSRVSPMGGTPSTIIVERGGSAQSDIATNYALTSVISQLRERLNEPFVTVNTVSGDTGIKQAQDEYSKLMRNKTPKSRRKS